MFGYTFKNLYKTVHGFVNPTILKSFNIFRGAKDFAGKANNLLHDLSETVEKSEYLPQNIRDYGSKGKGFSKVLQSKLEKANSLLDRGENYINTLKPNY